MSNPWTPGPWRAFYDKSMAEWHVKAGGWPLFPVGIDSGNPEADARLIAAAPALVEALECSAVDLDLLRRAIDAGDPKSLLLLRVEDIKRRERAALSLAKGEKP